jgi:serine/threonine-protein kinase
VTPAALGRYEILAELGRGAMGIVYKARDPLLDRVVAIKTVAGIADAGERAEYEARFAQEARAAGGLNHPGIVTIHDVGRASDIAYMAMEYVEGRELRDYLAGGAALPVAQAVTIARELAEALAYAHERGVVHRDIKPANVMITTAGHAKIMDFGIARLRTSDVRTQTGLLLGSPKYLSPEQVRGERAEPRSDIFALGVVLHEMLAGEPPFVAPDVPGLLYAIANVAPAAPSSRAPGVPPMLDLIVAKALAKEPEHRYATAAELAADLRACLADRGASTTSAPVRRGSDATRTLPLEAATAQMAHADVARDVGGGRPLSRRFDSTAAAQRLAAACGLAVPAGSTPEPIPSLTDPRRAPRRGAVTGAWTPLEKLAVAASVTIALVVAAGIAFG